MKYQPRSLQSRLAKFVRDRACGGPLWPTLALLAAVGLACTSARAPGASGAGPLSGQWQGPELAFFLKTNRVSALELKAQCCAAPDCKGAIGGPVAGDFSVFWSLLVDLPGTHVEGQFTSPTTASGTLEVSGGTCCNVVSAWTAEWVPGTSPEAADAQADTLEGGDAGALATAGVLTAATGSADWGGNSTGTVHPGPARAFASPAPPPTASAQQQLALTALNQLRTQVGSAPIGEDGALNQAAQAHAAFYVAHVTAYAKSGLSPHAEDPSFGDGFSGKAFWDRAKAAGFAGQASGEVMAFVGSPTVALQGWLETVYHRLPLIDPRSLWMGFGTASAGGNSADVMDVSQRNSKVDDPLVVYPWPGQTQVPASWSGNEGPQPPKPKGGYPSGPVVTARFPSEVQVTAHGLFDSSGKAIDHVWLDKDVDKNLDAFDPKTRVLYADKPLSAGTFRVRVAFNRAGSAEALEWRFTVGP